MSRLTGHAALAALGGSLATESGKGQPNLEEEVVALFDHFRSPLLRYLSGLGLTLADGEETVQEVFLALFQHLRDGKPRDHLRGWLFRVAHNLALKRRDRVRREGQVFTEQDRDLAIDPALNPEETLLHKKLRQRLFAVVEALPEDDRECLFLRAEGLTYREIAGILDISLGSVALSLTRSLDRIARAAQR